METKVENQNGSATLALEKDINSITVKKTIYAPQEVERTITLPYFSKDKSGISYYKVYNEKAGTEVWVNDGSAVISYWQNSGTTISSALGGKECTEEEFMAHYNKAKEIIESQISKLS